MFKSLYLHLILLFSLVAGLFAQGDQESFPSMFGANENYVLRPGDRIEVMVFNEPDLSASQLLDTRGQVSLPLLGLVQAKDKTVRELETHLKELYYDREFLMKPQVTVVVAQYATKQFYIFGEVRDPGIKEFPMDSTSLDIIQAISMAGDFTNLARPNSVRIKRMNEAGQEIIMTVDVASMLRGSGLRRNRDNDQFRVLPNDIIFVPERLF